MVLCSVGRGFVEVVWAVIVARRDGFDNFPASRPAFGSWRWSVPARRDLQGPNSTLHSQNHLYRCHAQHRITTTSSRSILTHFHHLQPSRSRFLAGAGCGWVWLGLDPDISGGMKNAHRPPGGACVSNASGLLRAFLKHVFPSRFFLSYNHSPTNFSTRANWIPLNTKSST